MDIDIEPGQLAALVGPTGAGKTTITYLVPRLYDVQGGGSRSTAMDVRKIALESLGDMIGVVTQETYLFHTTIRRNLLYGRPEATQEELEAAAGPPTSTTGSSSSPTATTRSWGSAATSSRAARSSAGHRARDLEGPADPDPGRGDVVARHHLRALVQAALEPLMQGRTTIAIAHRLSTILKADVIFVIDRGRVVERGTHEELLARGGLYARLYQQQFRGGLVEAEFEDGVILASGEVVPAGDADGPEQAGSEESFGRSAGRSRRGTRGPRRARSRATRTSTGRPASATWCAAS